MITRDEPIGRDQNHRDINLTTGVITRDEPIGRNRNHRDINLTTGVTTREYTRESA